MPAFRAARVEQEIVKVPKHEVVVALGGAQAAVAGGVDLEKDLAIHQQGEKLESRKTVLPAELFDLLRCGQHGEGGRNLRIADPEQRAGARRFQHHLVAAPPHIREPRQDENIGIAELRRSRPIVGNLRFDDDLRPRRFASARRRYSNRPCRANRRTRRFNFLVDGPAPDANEASGRPVRSVLRALRRAGAERSQADRIAIEASDDFSVGARFERDVTAEPGGNSWRPSPSPSLCFGSAHAEALRYGDESD